jgi:hypothetical protein
VDLDRDLAGTGCTGAGLHHAGWVDRCFPIIRNLPHGRSVGGYFEYGPPRLGPKSGRWLI